jgi:hypothetical protein
MTGAISATEKGHNTVGNTTRNSTQLYTGHINVGNTNRTSNQHHSGHNFINNSINNLTQGGRTTIFFAVLIVVVIVTVGTAVPLTLLPQRSTES